MRHRDLALEARVPGENGYQESFYDKFEIDFGDPDRFETLGELMAEIQS